MCKGTWDKYNNIYNFYFYLVLFQTIQTFVSDLNRKNSLIIIRNHPFFSNIQEQII
jgi:hypothetical protein